MQQAPGRWQWMPTQPKYDTRLIRTPGEWILFIGNLVALAIIVLVLVAPQIAAGWRW